MWFVKRNVNITVTHKKLGQIIVSAFILYRICINYGNLFKLN